MEKAIGQSSSFISNDYATFQDWGGGRQDLGRSPGRQWKDFKLVFDFSETQMFTFEVFLGSRNWTKVKYGAFPYVGGPLHPTEIVVRVVGESWRWENCRYTEGGQSLPVQIYGQVYLSLFGDNELPKGKAALELFTIPASAPTTQEWSVFWVDLGTQIDPATP